MKEKKLSTRRMSMVIECPRCAEDLVVTNYTDCDYVARHLIACGCVRSQYFSTGPAKKHEAVRCPCCWAGTISTLATHLLRYPASHLADNLILEFADRERE